MHGLGSAESPTSLLHARSDAPAQAYRTASGRTQPRQTAAGHRAFLDGSRWFLLRLPDHTYRPCKLTFTGDFSSRRTVKRCLSMAVTDTWRMEKVVVRRQLQADTAASADYPAIFTRCQFCDAPILHRLRLRDFSRRPNIAPGLQIDHPGRCAVIIKS